MRADYQGQAFNKDVKNTGLNVRVDKNMKCVILRNNQNTIHLNAAQFNNTTLFLREFPALSQAKAAFEAEEEGEWKDEIEDFEEGDEEEEEEGLDVYVDEAMEEEEEEEEVEHIPPPLAKRKAVSPRVKRARMIDVHSDPEGEDDDETIDISDIE